MVHIRNSAAAEAAPRSVRRPYPRPELADLGLHRLTRFLVAFQLCSALTVFGLMPWMGLSVAWETLPPFLMIDAVLVTAWIYFWRVPGSPREWIFAEAVLVMLLTIALTQILSPAQYVAAAFNRPLIDPYSGQGRRPDGYRCVGARTVEP